MAVPEELSQNVHVGIQHAEAARAHIGESISYLQSAYKVAAHALSQSADPEAATANAALYQGNEHAANAAELLIAGIGELATYIATDRTKNTTPTARIPLRPEENGRDALQPTHNLQFDNEEFTELIRQIPHLKLFHRPGVYEIPNHPDKLLRVDTMGEFTRGEIYTAEDNREHIRKYEAALTRLLAVGIPILRRTTRLVNHRYPGSSKHYTVVERHPDRRLLSEHNPQEAGLSFDSPVIKNIRSLYMHYTEPGEETAWNIEGDNQYAYDGTLLDYDLYLCIYEWDRGKALQHLGARLAALKSPLPEVAELQNLIQAAYKKEKKRHPEWVI
jgi:hypothetical protein